MNRSVALLVATAATALIAGCTTLAPHTKAQNVVNPLFSDTSLSDFCRQNGNVYKRLENGDLVFVEPERKVVKSEKAFYDFENTDYQGPYGMIRIHTYGTKVDISCSDSKSLQPIADMLEVYLITGKDQKYPIWYETFDTFDVDEFRQYWYGEGE